MRANEGALIALDAVFRNPERNVNGDAAFFKSSSAQREGTVLGSFEYRNRETVTKLIICRES